MIKKSKVPLWDDRTVFARWRSFRPWKGLESYDAIFPALKRWAIVRKHRR